VNTSKSDQARWFREEVQPHERSLRSYLRDLFPTLPDIDDLVQESCARLIRAKETGRISYHLGLIGATHVFSTPIAVVRSIDPCPFSTPC
jgi:hypothetical protein